MTRKAVFVQRLASDSCGDERNGLHNHTMKLTKQSFSNMCVPKLEFGNKLKHNKIKMIKISVILQSVLQADSIVFFLQSFLATDSH